MSKAENPKVVVPLSLYEQLRRDIICMEIAPGADLDEKQLVEKFGVSRTPVREALIRLAAEGLVETRRNRGATVTTLDLLTLQSIFEASDLIEKAFTRLACLRRTEANLKEIFAAKEQFELALGHQDISAMVQSNSDFHLQIANASGNKYFRDCYRRILADHERIAQIWYSRNLQQSDDQSSSLICQQHDQLFKAIEAKDALRAEAATVDHASLCKEGVRSTLIAGESIIEDIEIVIEPFQVSV